MVKTPNKQQGKRREFSKVAPSLPSSGWRDSAERPTQVHQSQSRPTPSTVTSNESPPSVSLMHQDPAATPHSSSDSGPIDSQPLPPSSKTEPFETEPSSPSRSIGGRLRFVGGGVVVIGLALWAGAWGAAWGARRYITEYVLPQLEEQLSDILNRDVELGELEFIWPTQAVIGESSVENLLNVQSVVLSADVAQWLWTREIPVTVTLEAPHILIQERLDRGWTVLQLSPPAGGSGVPLPIGDIDVRLNAGQVTAIPLQGSQRFFTDVQGDGLLRLDRILSEETDPASRNRDAVFELEAQLNGRSVDLRGQADILARQVDVTIEGEQIPLDLLPSLVKNLPMTDITGRSDVEVDVTWQLNRPLDVAVDAELINGGFEIPGVPNTFARIEGQLIYDDQQLRLNRVEGIYGQVPLMATGPIQFGEGGQYNLQGTVPATTLEALEQTFNFQLPGNAQGDISGTVALTGALEQPVISGQVDSISPGEVDGIPVSTYRTGFALNQSRLTLDSIQLQTVGGTVTGQGQLQLGSAVTANFQLALSDISTAQLTNQYGVTLPRSVGTLNGSVQVQLSGSEPPTVMADVVASGGEVSGQSQMEYRDGILQIPQAQLNLAGQGDVALNGQVVQGQITGQISPVDLNLGFFNPQLDDVVSGQFEVQVPTDALTLADLRAAGRAEFADGLGPISYPLQADVMWNGSNLVVTQGVVQQSQGGELARVQGRIPVDTQTIELGDLDLDIQVPPIALNSLPQLPEGVDIEGQVSGTADLTGPLDNLNLQGDLTLESIEVGGVTFPLLQGPVVWSAAGGGTRLDLQGNDDQIMVALNDQFRPTDFTVKKGSLMARGSTTGTEVQVSVAEVPLALITDLVPGSTLNSLGGQLDGEVAYDWAEQTATGSLQIDSLRFASVQTDQIKVDFNFEDGQVRIPQASLELFESEYQVTGFVSLPSGSNTDGGQLNLSVATTSATLQDIVSTFKWQTWDDVSSRGLQLPALGPAEAVAADPLLASVLPLLDQLERYETAVERYRESRVVEQSPIPQPPSLVGSLDATVTVAGSLTNPDIRVAVEGTNWSAEEFELETVTLRGSYFPTESRAVIETVSAQFEDRSAEFAGVFNSNDFDGSLAITRLPLEQFQAVIPSDLTFAGDLNADLSLSGTLTNPQAAGTVALLGAQVDQIPIPESRTYFDYNRGVLNLDNTTLLGSTEGEPIQVYGTVPYTLPFAEVRSTTNQIDLTLDLPEDGLELANLLTDQVTWESGESELDLQMRGTLQEPILEGSLAVDQGQLRVQALPEPITNVAAQISFDFNRLTVDELTGQYSSGSLSAVGVLPINSRGALSMQRESEQPETQPLELMVSQVDVNLPQGYRGTVDGTVEVGGVLLKPILGGELELSEGVVDLTPTSGTASPEAAVPVEDLSGEQDPFTIVSNLPPDRSVLAEPSAPQQPQPDREPGFMQMGGLKVILGSDVEVVRRQLFNFTTTGDVLVSGTFDDPRLTGELTLDRGSLTLPGAEFRLDRSRPNRVRFVPDSGLDPLLDVHLITRVAEVYPPSQSLDTNTNIGIVGFQNTIDVMARVQGYASELTSGDPTSDVLEVSSRPPRSDREIFALLGGNFIASLGTGAGVAGLAGQGILDTIGESLGFDEVRLGPIPTVSTSAPNRASVGLGLEVAKDLGPAISFSAQQNLTDSFQPTRYSARYRLNPETLIRLGTDFEGNSVMSVEFDTRF